MGRFTRRGGKAKIQRGKSSYEVLAAQFGVGRATVPSRAIRRASGTADNLRRRGRITLCFVEAGMAYYVKASVALPEESMPGCPDLVRFEAIVEQVLADEARADSEPGAAIVDGVRFCTGRPAAAVLRDWRRVVGGLRGHV